MQLRPGGKGGWFASDLRPTPDPATDFPLLRLTSPAYSSRLPDSRLRAVARTGAFVLFSSDRGGSVQVCRLELSSGRQYQLTAAAAVDPSTPALLPDDGSFCYFDGDALLRVSLKNLRGKPVYRVPEGWRREVGFSLARDGSYAALVEARGELSRLRLVKVSSGRALTLAEGRERLADPALRTRREGALFRWGASLGWVDLDGRRPRRLPLPPGRLGHFTWAPDGKSVFYLHQGEGAVASVLREHRLDSGADQAVAPTSAFATFSVNGDASVFVGASGSRAAPYVLLLLRVSRRELALCEHRAADPAQAAPVFSPDSQRVYFQTDREGRWAIYQARVEKLLEPTEARL